MQGLEKGRDLNGSWWRVRGATQATPTKPLNGFWGIGVLGAMKVVILTKNDGRTIYIRKYGSTFYIGIAMVVLPYFGPWKN